MKVLTEEQYKEVKEKYSYQLLKPQFTQMELTPFLKNFKKYKKEHKGVIVNIKDGWTIYTTGELIKR